MKEADETDRESGYVVLPDEIEGKTISWHYAKDMRSVGIICTGDCGSGPDAGAGKTE